MSVKKHRRKRKLVTTPVQLVSVVNLSPRITPAEAQRMTLACAKQLARDLSPFWGLVPAVEFVPPNGTPTPGGAICHLRPTIDVDDALGYHDEDENGNAYIEIGVDVILDSGGKVLEGPNSVPSVMSHEFVELVGDGPANRWVDGPNGADYALELADAVQDTWYDVDGVSVSNFLLQAFFDPRAAKGSRLDFLGKLTKPFSMTSGGYQITRTEPGKVAQVFGEHHSRPVHTKLNVHSINVHFGEDVTEGRRRGIVNKVRRRRGA